MNRLKKQLIASKFLSIVNHLPKDESKIVFYSTPDISDNSLALFRCIASQNYGYDLVWLLNDDNPSGLEKLTKEYDARAVSLFSAKGLKELIRARFVITSDVLPVTPHSGQKVIQLWHGLPGKKTGYEHPLKVKDLYLYMDRWTSYFITTSELVVGAFVRQFMINPRKFKLLGQPRNDGLFENLKKSRDLLSNILGLDIESFDGIILYAPTYRYTSYLKDYRASVNVVRTLLSKKFTNFLRKENLLLVIKPHKLVGKAIADSIVNSKNMILLGDQPLQERLLTINDIMGAFDMLITDYSSIFEDYILTERPIVFYLPDRKELERKSGFLLPYNFFAPGEKSETINELIQSLKAYLEDPTRDVEWRKTVKSFLYEVGADPHSSERVYRRLIRGE